MSDEQTIRGSEDFSPTSFDLCRTMETVMDSEELFQTIADMLIEAAPGYIERIRNAIAENDAGTLEREAHSLKGAVGNFGADGTYEAAFRLEKMGKSGELAMAEEGFSELEKVLDKLMFEMKIVLGRMQR